MTFDPIILLWICLAFVFCPGIVRLKPGETRGATFGIGWLVLLAVAVATTVLSIILMPKPKAGKPASASDLENPTNDAGREMMVVWGEGVVKSGNYLWYGEKGVRSYKVKA